MVIREEDRILAGASVVILSSLASQGLIGPSLDRCFETLNIGLSMMGMEDRISPGVSVNASVLRAVEVLLARFAPVESVIGG